ncbi:MAG: EstA family serine hydrolase [Proteobacteria bacterium]|nr:MAG: EstA family serine hydrolase [Pseudomonadota bacterium]
MGALEISGHCDARFARVRDVFAEQMANPEELGAAVAVTLGGRLVVDLWAGHADAKRTRPWTADTLVNLFSTTKGMTALCAHRLADAGELDLDAPVARYWPEFAQADKGAIPVRWLLDHSAGLAAIEKPLPMGAVCDWDAVTSALAEQAPLWEPGSTHGYHALTFGWLVGEVVRRVAGRSVGAYFRDEIAGPLGADVWIGLPEQHDARTAQLVPAPMPAPGQSNFLLELAAKAKPWALKSFLNPLPPAGGMNSRAWRAAEIPAANGHGSARGIARVYAALAAGGALDGVRVLSREQIDVARSAQRSGVDFVIPMMPTKFALGYQLGTDAEPIGPNPRAFGHSGAGGSLGVADPEAGLAFGYAMNRMESGLFLIGPRATALMNAAFASLR